QCTARPWTDVAAPPDDLYFRRNDHTGLRRGQSTAAGQVPPKRAWRTMMMQAIRGRAGSIIVKVLFGLLIISFGFWGVYTRSDYLQGHSPETVVATVGDDNIRADDLQRVLQPTLERLRAHLGGAIAQQQIKPFGVV